MTIDRLHIQLARDVLGDHPAEDDALALMLLLHTHRIILSAAILQDRPGITELAALTQRDAAMTVALAWPQEDARRPTSTALYWTQVNELAFEVVDDFPPEWKHRVARCREALLRDPQVAAVEPED